MGMDKVIGMDIDVGISWGISIGIDRGIICRIDRCFFCSGYQLFLGISSIGGLWLYYCY